MNDLNNEEVKRILNKPDVPEKLSPESVKKDLDMKKANGSKKINFTNGLKWCAGIAACAVLLGTGGIIAKQMQNNSSSSMISGGSYTVSASDYKQVYRYMKNYMDKLEEQKDFVYEDGGEIFYEEAAEEMENDSVTTETTGSDSLPDSDNNEISELYNQETGVLEGDIIRTDGNRIYSALNSESFNIQVTETDGKVFIGNKTLNLYEYLPDSVKYCCISAMYLENDRLIVAADTSESYSWENVSQRTYVLIFDTESDIQLLGSYAQDGNYSDIRLMKDGALYIISSYNWTAYYTDENYKKCIPSYYTNKKESMAAPEDILLPGTGAKKGTECDFGSGFTNIGSLNVFSDTPWESLDFKSLAGFSGSMYCSLNNIYLASNCWTENGNSTDFTRIKIDNGIITPEASTNVPGYVKDQFSMSEYKGYFRAAVSRDRQMGYYGIPNDNAVYIFDMNMNKVSEIGGFGENETIKSASFSGDMAYVVTYRQTDPLYAIDLSDVNNPVILDEYKITGYSSYMQQWNDDLLLGFGINADEDGIRNGLKLVMFDNSDPDNLSECGIMPIDYTDVSKFSDEAVYGWIDSPAVNDRKALLISPEKNLIAVPFSCYAENYIYDETDCYGYSVYSYENGIFRNKGVIYSKSDVSRAIYIGDTMFIAGKTELIAIDIPTMNENDRIYF